MSAAYVSPALPTFTTEGIFRLTVDQYLNLMDAGILQSGDPVELLEGVLVQKMAIRPPHTGTVRRCQRWIEPRLPDGWRYRLGQPIILSDGMPEPDGVVARGTSDDDDVFHPPAADVCLVIEVADSTLARDRTIKLRSYARAGIPVYWIVNLIDRQLEVYTDPDPTATPETTYRRRDLYVGDATLMVPVVNATVSVAELLPRG